MLARVGRATAAGDDLPAGDEAREAVATAVLARCRDWRSQLPVTVVTGLPGSGKTAFLAEVIRRLAGSRTWYVPVPRSMTSPGAASMTCWTPRNAS